MPLPPGFELEEAPTSYDGLPPGFEIEDVAPAPKASSNAQLLNMTLGSQLALRVPETMQDMGVSFQPEQGISGYDQDAINRIKRNAVMREATQRVYDPPSMDVARGLQKGFIDVADAAKDPVNLGIGALTYVAPPIGVGILSGLAAKSIGEGSGALSVPGALSDSEAVRQMIGMGLMTAGAAGSAKFLRTPPPQALAPSIEPTVTVPPVEPGQLTYRAPELGGRPAPQLGFEAPRQLAAPSPEPIDIESRVEPVPPQGFELEKPSAKEVDPNWQVTVQAPQAHESGRTIPGYVQIDDVSGGQNRWSKGPETLRNEGYNVPDLSELPSGKYTMKEAQDAVSKLRSNRLPEAQAPSDIQPVGEEVRPSAGEQSAPQEPEQKEVAKPEVAPAPSDDFVLQASKLLKSPERLRYSADRKGEVDAGQLVNRLMNLVPTDERAILEPLREQFPAGQKTTFDEVAKAVQALTPRAEVRVLKSGGNKGGQEFANLQHQAETRGYEVHRMGNEMSLAKPGGDIVQFSELPKADQTLVQNLNNALAESTKFSSEGFDPDIYRGVAPKDADQTVVMVKVPTEKSVTGESADEYGILHRGSHFGPEDKNVLGWARIQYEQVGDKKVAHIIEVQSDWAKEVKKLEKELGKYPEGRYTITPSGRPLQAGKELDQLDHPLLNQHERLVLKAAMDQARKDGADAIAISDSPTAMMTEGHYSPELIFTRDESFTFGDDADAFIRELEDDDIPHFVEPNGRTIHYGEKQVPKQKKGMELHYDKILPKIAEELTGNKGEKVDFGEHQLAEHQVAPQQHAKALMFNLDKAKEARQKAPYSLFGKDKPLKFYSGLPIPTISDIVDAVKHVGEAIKPLAERLNNDLKTLGEMLANRETIKSVGPLFDSIDNVTHVVADMNEKALRLVSTKIFKAGQEADLARKAATFALEAGSQSKLTAMATKLQGNREAAQAIDFAQKNWTKVNALANAARQIDQQNQVTSAIAGRPYVSLEEQLKTLYNTSERGLFLKGREEDPGSQAFGSLADAIAAGRKPLSLDLAALLNKVTTDIQRVANTKVIVEGFKKVTDDKGNPIITDLVKGKAQLGYVRNPELNVGVVGSHSDIFKAMTGHSVIEESHLGHAALKAVGTVKHGTFAFDVYHASKMLWFRGSLGGLGFKKGLSLLEYSKGNLREAINQGLAPKEAETYANTVNDLPQGKVTNRGLATMFLRRGFNVGRHSENLYSTFVRTFPIVKQTAGASNRFIFDKLTRGAMMESALIEARRIAKLHPTWPLEQVVDKVTTDLNFRFGNPGRQAIIKSKEMQAISQLLFSAPKWVESMAQSEARSAFQLAQSVNPKSEHFLKLGSLAKSTGAILLFSAVAAQVLNYFTTGHGDPRKGHGTWGNPEGHKLDAWIPPLSEGGKGFYVSPASVAAELTHDMIRYGHSGLNTVESLARIFNNKASSLTQATRILIYGTDWKDQKINDQWERVKQAAVTAANAMPLLVRQVKESVKQKDITLGQRQAFSLLGIKAEPESPTEQLSRQVQGKTLDQRYEMEKQRLVKRAPYDIDQSEAAGEVAQRHEAQRRKDLISQLPSETRVWLTGHGLTPPGFDDKINYQKVRLPLTPEETTKYRDYIASEYNTAIQSLAKDLRFDKASAEEQKLVFNSIMLRAKKVASAKMLQELYQGPVKKSP